MSESKKGVSRRDFLKTGGIAAGTLVGGGLIGGLVGRNYNKDGTKQTKSSKETKGESPSRGWMFFQNSHEFDVLSQAVERLFPEDDLGPGAIGLGVPYFIDNQLAGSYGYNTHEYMQGPFYKGEPTQGYQGKLNRVDIFRNGIKVMDKEANERHDQNFDELDGEQMDEILTDLQKDNIDMKGVKSGTFFEMLLDSTLSGAYSDPIYNGNIDMEGWKMKNFPGNQMSYIKEIEEEFTKMAPKSLSSMQK